MTFSSPPNDPVILRLDKSGRRGKIVTLIQGLRLHPEGKETLLRELKQSCGAGGTLKMGTLEIQGDQRDRVQKELEKRGHQVKRAGG